MYITHANSIIESIKNNKGFELYISKKSPKTKEIEQLAKNTKYKNNKNKYKWTWQNS